jgi:hypothetical protein
LDLKSLCHSQLFISLILILCVNWKNDIHISPETLLCIISVKVFLEEISLFIYTLSNDHSHPCRWVSFQLWKDLNRTRKQKRKFFCVLELDIHLLLPSQVITSVSWSFRISLELIPLIPQFRHWTGTTSPDFLGIQLENSRL